MTPYCRHCSIFGHTSESCIPTYANTVGNNNSLPKPTPVQENKEKTVEKKKSKKRKQTSQKDNTQTDTDEETWQVARYKGKKMIKERKQNTHEQTEEDTNIDTDNTDISPYDTTSHMDTEEEREIQHKINKDIQEEID